MFQSLIAKLLPNFPESFVWKFSKKYIAGKDLESLRIAARKEREKGAVTTVDLLGEEIQNMNEAHYFFEQYSELIPILAENDLDVNISIKPSMFGMKMDKETCYKLYEKIIEKVAKYPTGFVRIDMEDSSYTSMEIALYEHLLKKYPKNVGLVIQAYLYRSNKDVVELMEKYPDQSLNFRLCKGIYLEPKEVAYQDKQEVRDSYIRILKSIINHGGFVGIATHDSWIVEEALSWIRAHEIPKSQYEFQCLCGVKEGLKMDLIKQGEKERVYIPFGEHWFAYSTRRLKENPKMVNDIIKAFFSFS
ncbi:proline dehydrogenase family protein [Halosquirtibacter xylanolyticus]|uniref:proline dehydrogenase family protein n=1 Tax=Halosquirtibacter xylanolyticus TaxID=3374599 RepID=UPI0037486542|nr:proline dehydrogenase family protein [Prolixibacteraceae bacterium]